MANPSINDTYFVLQVRLKEFRVKGRKSKKYDYHYDRALINIEKRIRETLRQSINDIDEFEALMRDVEGEENTDGS